MARRFYSAQARYEQMRHRSMTAPSDSERLAHFMADCDAYSKLRRKHNALWTGTLIPPVLLAGSIPLAVNASTVGTFLAANISFLSGASATLSSLALGIGIATAVISAVAFAVCLPLLIREFTREDRAPLTYGMRY